MAVPGAREEPRAGHVSGPGMTTSGESPSDAADAARSTAAITIVMTEHYTLSGARVATVAEAHGRASVFLGTLSGAL
jgi:hypothetical protein